MNIVDSKNNVALQFDDILDYVEYANAVPDKNYSKTNDDDGWCGGTFDDAVKQATTGNPDLVKDFFDGVNVIAAMIEEEKTGEIRDVTGEYFDVADYLSGEPEVFRRDEFCERKPVVPVYANFSMHGDISTEIIKNRGIAITALCDELSKSGFIVDLNVVHAVSYCGKKYYTKIHLQNDPLDIDTLAFCVANPLCLRRLNFAKLERVTGEHICLGYGRPSEYDFQEIFDIGLSGFYFTSSGHKVFRSSYYNSLENAKNHVLGMIEKFKDSAEQVILG